LQLVDVAALGGPLPGGPVAGIPVDPLERGAQRLLCALDFELDLVARSHPVKAASKPPGGLFGGARCEPEPREFLVLA